MGRSVVLGNAKTDGAKTNKVTEESYKAVIQNMDQGFCLVELIFDDQGKPEDYRFLETNPAFSGLVGVKDIIGKTARTLWPEMEDFWAEVYGKVALTGEAVRFEHGSKVVHGYFDVFATRVGEANSRKVAIIFNDVNERRRAELGATFLTVLSDTIRRTDDPDDLLNKVCELTAKHFGVSHCVFSQVDVVKDLAANTHEYRSQKSERVSLLGTFRLSDHPRFYLDRLSAGQPVVVNDTATDPNSAELYDSHYRPSGARSVLSVPVLRERVWVGSLFVNDTRPRQWQGSELHLLETVAERSWLALERLYSEQALRDSEAKRSFALASAGIGEWALDVATGKAERSLLHDKIFGANEPFSEWNFELFISFVHPEDRVRVESSFLEALREGKPWNFDCRILWRDGSLHWINAQGRIYYEGHQPLRMIGIVQDITERKLAEEALREADRRKDEFLAILAHELRNPLAPIRMSLEIMKRSQDTSAHQEARAIIERQSEQMVRLVDDLLDVSRVTRGKINLYKERLTLNEVIHLAVETAKPLLAEKNHKLVLDLPMKDVLLEADKTRLSQVFLNLLTNAAKYTPAGGKLSVTAELEANRVVVRVKDTGIGIAPEMLTKVFELFARVEFGEAARQEGLGIGLYLVKRLVDLHGGTITASSAGLGQGSEFTVHLPVLENQTQQGAVPIQASSHSGTVSQRVLVVDDYEANLHTLARMLRLMGHEVMTADGGNRALEVLPNFRPDFVFLDLNMPGLSGYEVARRIRAEPRYDPIKLIALTGYGTKEDVRKTSEAGFQHHLVKPIDMKVLESLLSTS